MSLRGLASCVQARPHGERRSTTRNANDSFGRLPPRAAPHVGWRRSDAGGLRAGFGLAKRRKAFDPPGNRPPALSAREETDSDCPAAGTARAAVPYCLTVSCDSASAQIGKCPTARGWPGSAEGQGSAAFARRHSFSIPASRNNRPLRSNSDLMNVSKVLPSM